MRFPMRNDLEEHLPGVCSSRGDISIFDDEFYEFAKLLERATKEQQVQGFLQGHPRILAAQLTGLAAR